MRLPYEMLNAHMILIRDNYDFAGWLIRKFTNSEWNHIVWIFEDCIIESKSTGIVLKNINKYFSSRYEIKFIRIKNLTQEQRLGISKILLKSVHKKSYLKWIWTFFMLLIGYNGKLLRKTCSGFIANNCAIFGIYFKEGKKSLHITPEDINSSSIIEEVSF